MANYLLNCCSTRALTRSTPFTHLNQHKPDLSHVKVIGCLAHVHVPIALRSKFDSRSILQTVFVGYDEHSKAYQCFFPQHRKIFISRNILFDEGQLGIRQKEMD